MRLVLMRVEATKGERKSNEARNHKKIAASRYKQIGFKFIKKNILET